jgi:hypothetical protein
MPMVRRCKQKARVIKLEIEMLEKRSKYMMRINPK